VTVERLEMTIKMRFPLLGSMYFLRSPIRPRRLWKALSLLKWAGMKPRSC